MSRQFLAEWIGLIVGVVVVGAIVGSAIYKNRVRAETAERERLSGQAHVVRENIGQQLAGVDRALATVREEFVATPSSRVPAVLSPRLKALADAIAGVRSMAVLDAAGSVVAASVPSLVGLDFSDRGYFQTLRSRGDATMLYVAPPWKTSLGNYTVVLGRVVTAPDGSFAGAALAALEPEYMDVLLRSVLYAPDMWVSLGHAGGKVFLTMPRDPGRVEADWPGMAALGQPPGAASGAASGDGSASPETTVVIGRLGGSDEQRMTALLAVAPAELRMDRPLVIAVSRALAEVFRPWRQQAFEYASFFAALVLAAAFGLYRGQARRSAFAALEASASRDRQRDAERLELALHATALGLWDWDVVADRFEQNSVDRLRLGYAPDEIGLDGPEWRALIHPGDAHRMQLALAAHCRGETEAYEIEYRMRHKAGHWVWVLSRAKVVERDEAGAPLRMVGTHMDLSSRKRAEAALERSAQMLQRTGELGRIGGWELELATGELTWSEQLYRIHELEPTVRPNLAMAIDFYAPEVRQEIDAAVRSGVERGLPWDLELPFVTARGTPLWVRTQGVAFYEDGRPTRLMGAFQDITERKTTALQLHRLNEQLTRLSTIDSLTEVGNRRLFDQTLSVEWARAARRGEAVALLMIDIDHFKEYNDHYGHPAGDACLRQVAQLIGEAVRRGGELVARYGGEEFAVLLPGVDLAAACVVAERCRAVLAAAKIEHRALTSSTWLSASIGVASQVASAATAGQVLVDIADAALYRAKRCGRDRIES